LNLELLVVAFDVLVGFKPNQESVNIARPTRTSMHTPLWSQ